MGNIKVGDWVTQYRTGYWMVKELHPKFSPFEVGSVHKGDWQGYYAVLQKAFGSTFKFGIAFDSCDVSLCSPVSKEQLARIETYFEEHPKDKLKFESAKVVVPPSITTVHLQIDDQQQAVLSAAIDRMLPTLVMMPKVVGVVLDQMTRIVRFWSFAFLNNSIIAVQEKIPLYKVLKMLFRESAMDS